ncbi:MAG: right-handed parallel beta-helix repeat-containing protein [Haloarculaceae archaeon]
MVPQAGNETYSRRDVLRSVGAGGIVGGGLQFAYDGEGGAGSGGEFPAGQPDRGEPRRYEDFATHRVPREYGTIQAAVDAASPRDLVLVGPGVYREAVTVTDTPRLTIRGTSRNDVVLDGEFQREDAVFVTADDVVLENMTARHYTRNAFFWTAVEGYRGSYLTAHNNRLYGVYAFDSVHGRFENSYASGHTDSGFYVGQCEPCHALVENVRAEYNAVGYSGTNAGGYLTVRDSVWRHNMGGIVPNSLDTEANPPQDSVRVEGNLVEANHDADAPDSAFGYAAFGTGINVAGGRNNVVVDNTVRDHANFGIVAVPMIDANLYEPSNNRFEGNDVSGSGRADLALGEPQAGGNEFVDNDAGSARPARLNGGFSLLAGDPWVTLVLIEQFLQLEMGASPRGNWQTAPEPPFDELEPMPDPERPPREAVRRNGGGGS